MAGTLDHVTIVEVAPRDGLQNDHRTVPTEAKIAFINALSAAGLPVIEATSFVNPAAVPKMADADAVMRGIARRPGVRYPVLIPNERGFERAVEAGGDAIALFAAATEAFSRANIRCSVDESFARFAPVARRALDAGMWLRGYVSVAFDCPYSGAVAPTAAAGVAERLFALGCHEVSIADTIGTATPVGVERMIDSLTAVTPVERIAMHFHDTHAAAVANVLRAFDLGIRVFDSSAGGLGGCPFAPGAPGNVATEAVVRAFDEMGVPTGVDANAVERTVAILDNSQTGYDERPD